MMQQSHTIKEINEEKSRSSRLKVRVAEGPAEIRECLALRYEVFANEMGAKLPGDSLDQDRFDDACTHLMVYDEQTEEVIATTRLLCSDDAEKVGGFYSETEFDLSRVLSRPFKFMEVGRTCIHPAFRSGAALALLWHGIAREVAVRKIDYLMGCASIEITGGDRYLSAVMNRLRTTYYSDADFRVHPRVAINLDYEDSHGNVILPTLLKGYLKQGAVICGEPYWDAEFGVVDVFVLLNCERLARRYVRHFMDRISA